MLKFFRKHNKKLLAIFMALLMIVFIGGSALENLLTPSTDRVVAESQLGSIGYKDQQRAMAMTQILNRLGIPWDTPFPGATTPPLQTIDWILLTREAERMGLKTSPPAAKAWAAKLFEVGVDELARRLRIKQDHILDAIAEYLAIRQTGQAVLNAAVPSVAEARTVGAQTLDKVLVNAVVLPAKAFYDPEAEFSEEEIMAQWSAYRDNEPGKGLNCGYYVSPAVKVQYVKIDRDVLMERAGVANLARKARQYYDKNQTTDPLFRRPAEQMHQPDPEGGDAGFVGPEPPPYLNWEDVRDAAMDKVRRENADEVAERVANWLIEQAAVRWIDLTPKENGYKTAPADVAALDHYDKLIERLPPSMSFPEAVSVRMTGFFNEDTAATVESIGTAAFRPPSGLSLTFKVLAFLNEGIVESIPTDEGTVRGDYMARYQTCQYPLTDFAGNHYLFRVMETQPGHPAESVDEVRQRVLADMRLLRGLDSARARAEGLRACTPGETLQEAYESDASLVELMDSPDASGGGYFESSLVSRATLQQATSGEANAQVFVPGGVGLVPAEVVDRWFHLEFTDDKTAIMELKDRASVLLVEWVETQTGREDEYEEQNTRLVSQLTERRVQDALQDWLDPQQIRARNGFALVER